MPDSILSTAERALILELQRRGLRFMIVGMSGALLQGARGATEDIDLWLENPTDLRVAEAVKAAGGIWISGSFGMGPPQIGGEELSERFDVVVQMSGLGNFEDEYEHVRFEEVDGLQLPVLNLARIVHSKRSANRPKDLASLPALEDALTIIRDQSEGDDESGEDPSSQ